MASFIPSSGDGAVHLKRTSPDGASAERAAIKCSLRALKHPETEEDVDRVLRRVSSLARHRPQHEAVRNYVGHATLHHATSGTPLARAALPLVGAALKFSREGFERALADEPTEWAPRLVFADWLDEHGHPEAAARARWFHAAINHEPKPGTPNRAVPAWVWALHDRHDIARLGDHTPESRHHNAQLELSALGLVPHREAQENAQRDLGAAWQSRNRNIDETIVGAVVNAAHAAHSFNTHNRLQHYEPTRIPLLYTPERQSTADKITQYAALNPPPGAQAGRVAERPGA